MVFRHTIARRRASSGRCCRLGAMAIGIILAAAASAQGPRVVVDEAISDWALADGFIAWTLDNDSDSNGYLRRRSTLNSPTRTLAESLRLSPRAWHWGLTIDPSGLYYYSPQTRRILRRPADRDDEEITLVTLGPNLVPRVPVLMAGNSTHLYWATSNRILRVDKNGGRSQLVATVRTPTSLSVDDQHVYWLSSRGVWRAGADCPGPGNCAPQRLADDGGELSWLGEDHLYWIAGGSGAPRIRRLDLRTRRVQTLYEAADRRWRLSQPIASATHVFWKEHRLETFPDARIMRLPLNRLGSRPSQIAGGLDATGLELAMDDSDIYFSGADRRLVRLVLDAPPVARDLRAVALEVTQGIQNWQNDAHLSAEKPTVVRLFGDLQDGPPAYAVDAELHGRRDGRALPGSPLRPLNGPMLQREGETPVRSQVDGGWLFELPAGWLGGGRLQLEGVVDPAGIYRDTRPANNRVVQQVLLKDQPPTCAVLVPIRGNGPMADPDNAPFRAARRRAAKLLPSPRLRTFTSNEPLEELEVCLWQGLVPYPCWGPYEMGGDPDKVIFALALRAAHTDDPDSCEDEGALVQYVGMVHDRVFTSSAGKGNFCRPWSWIQLPPATATPTEPAWAWPRHGATLAHELGHNFERYHVPCGATAAVDRNYPYPACQLDCLPGDEGCPQTLADDPGRVHFGFDIDSQTPIAPDQAGDVMSYSHLAGSPRSRWVSDYTWNEIAIKQRTQGPDLFSCVNDFILSQTSSITGTRQPPPPKDGSTSSGTTIIRGSASQATKPRPLPKPVPKPGLDTVELARASHALLIGGTVSPRRGESRLRHGWVRPVGDLGSGMLRRWQQQVTPAYKPGDTTFGGWHLRIHGADGRLLADRTVVPMTDAQDAAESKARPFLLAAPLPRQALGHIALWRRNQEVAVLKAGANPPRVRITHPRGGERFDGSFDIRWQGVDPDRGDIPLYTVQYSHDGGKHWQALATDHPGHPESRSHKLQVNGLRGSSSQALIRVLASDGLHTAESVSQPFAVRNQPPKASIDRPLEGSPIPAGRPVTLRGGADDPELGSVPDKGLSWTLDGEAVGAGAVVQVDGLAPGSYAVELLARDPQARGDRSRRTLEIAPLGIPRRSDVRLDGHCGDAAYRHAPVIGLAPYGRDKGTRASVRAVHHDGHLWMCFSNLLRTPRIAGRPSVSRVGIRVDGERNGGTALTRGDRGFFVREDGIPVSRRVDAKGRLIAAGPSAVAARVLPSEGRHWSAEMRVRIADLVKDSPLLALTFRHENLGPDGRTSVGWPFRAHGLQPRSWATAHLEPTRLNVDGITKPRLIESSKKPLAGRLPPKPLPIDSVHLEGLLPDRAEATRGPLAVEVRGRGFRDGMKVLWNGEPRPTRFVSRTRMVVQLSDRDFIWGRTVSVSVDPGEGSITRPLPFEVLPKASKPARP